MYEIELKAHVKDRNSVLEKIKSFSDFDRIIVKDDQYYKLEKSGGEHVTCRIRKEEYSTEEIFDISKLKFENRSFFLTYKKKEKKLSSNGKLLEVNQELETGLEDMKPLEELLFASGYTPYFTKHKDAVSFYAKTEEGEAHLELCTVPPLGDFLEIEMLSENPSENEIARKRKVLEELIVESGIELSEIENKYYSELLKEAREKKELPNV